MNDDAMAFMRRFLDDIGAVSDRRARDEIALLLASSLERGGDAWRPLAHAVATLVAVEHPCVPALTRLRAFVRENIDLIEGDSDVAIPA